MLVLREVWVCEWKRKNWNEKKRLWIEENAISEATKLLHGYVCIVSLSVLGKLIVCMSWIECQPDSFPSPRLGICKPSPPAIAFHHLSISMASENDSLTITQDEQPSPPPYGYMRKFRLYETRSVYYYSLSLLLHPFLTLSFHLFLRILLLLLDFYFPLHYMRMYLLICLLSSHTALRTPSVSVTMHQRAFGYIKKLRVKFTLLNIS